MQSHGRSELRMGDQQDTGRVNIMTAVLSIKSGGIFIQSEEP